MPTKPPPSQGTRPHPPESLFRARRRCEQMPPRSEPGRTSREKDTHARWVPREGDWTAKRLSDWCSSQSWGWHCRRRPQSLSRQLTSATIPGTYPVQFVRRDPRVGALPFVDDVPPWSAEVGRLRIRQAMGNMEMARDGLEAWDHSKDSPWE